MHDHCDIDEKAQILRKVSEAEKCIAKLSDADIEGMENTGMIDDDTYLVIKILKNKNK